MWIGHWRGVVSGVVRSAKSGLWVVCNFRLLRVSNLCQHQTKAVFDLKLMVVWVCTKWCLTRVGSGCTMPMLIGS